MKATRWILIVSALAVSVNLIFVMQACAASINASMLIGDSFKTPWIKKTPDLSTVTEIDFNTANTNYNLAPSAVTGDFAWSGTGTQPDYTMNPNGTNTQYVGHIGGSSTLLSIGNQSFDPAGNGANFLTWYVDVPSTGGTDMMTFNLTSEQILSSSSTNLNVYLLGNATDADGHWSSSPSSLNLTVTQSGGTYTWAATWTGTTPEPASILLFGLGLAVMGASVFLLRT